MKTWLTRGVFIPLLHTLSKESYQKDAETKGGMNNYESMMTALYKNETYKNHFRKNDNQSFFLETSTQAEIQLKLKFWLLAIGFLF
jgi:hypothetical protein